MAMVAKIGGGLRRVALVAVVLAMVIGAGSVALIASNRATADQEGIHRTDRLALANSLATLANGYFLQLDLAQADTGTTVATELGQEAKASVTLDRALATTPGAPTAVVVDSTGHQLAASRGSGSLNSAVAGLMGPLAAAGRRGPAVSSVFELGGQPSVAIAVPCGTTGAQLIVAYRLQSLPIAAYVQKLQIGPGAQPYVIDAQGHLVTDPTPAGVGRMAPSGLASVAARVNAAQVVQTRGSSPLVVAVTPVGLGGWKMVIAQPASQFYGALWHGNSFFRWAMLLLLVVVAAALLRFHARRQTALQAIAEMAVKDSLTGLPNRLAFTKSLGAAMDRHQRGDGDAALLFCDLDGFKAVNDRLGHDAGDALLIAAAGRMRECVRSFGSAQPTLARLGGDEFTILLQGGHARASANTLATALSNAFSEPFVLGPEDVSVGVSVGIAMASPERDLLRDADVAMYRAKAIRKAARAADTPDQQPAAAGPVAVRQVS
ncbi:MAG TPA: sensor domain-containing diguanylate cyclase [Acidimicrobiales bacterium]|jgi:diguanylate cyclase (GGDEF)-like protein|nr:sensor domain-containing diguanylate cyclase [Acidimicrobiales bacterium]